VQRALAGGGLLRFTFAGGAFISGRYTPPGNFNERSPFPASDTFTFVVEDDGKTTFPGTGGITVFLTPQRSQPATVTLRVLPANDPPRLEARAAVHILERPENDSAVIPQWATLIAPGPETALDELLRQSVTL